MARRRRSERALGPYPHFRKWRVIVVGDRGQRTVKDYESEEEARSVVRSLRRKLDSDASKTVEEARVDYKRYLEEEKQNRARSVDATEWRLSIFFTDGDELLAELTPAACTRYYERLRARPSKRTKKALSVDSHRNILAEAKTFLKWCVAKRWLKINPLEDVQGVGKRRHGKPQLRIDEARSWLLKASELADGGEAGAVAAMVSLLMGLRASEIVSRVVRDLDDDGRLLWIPDSKTEKGRRTVQVPEVLRPHLQELAKGKTPFDRLFGRHWRDWPREWVQRICRAAKVPEVTAHGMRGLHGTLAVDAGVTSHAVAAALGHESERPRARATSRRARWRTRSSGGCSGCWRAG